MKTLNKLALISVVFAIASCRKTQMPTPVSNPPPDTSAFKMTVYLNNNLLRHNTTDTIKIDSAAGMKINISWPVIIRQMDTVAVQLWVSLYSADSLTFRWNQVYGEDPSHEFTWEAAKLPKQGKLTITGTPDASSKKKPDTLNAFIIIK